GSYFRHPAPDFIVAHRRPLVAVADAAVAGKVLRGQTRIGLVPDIGRNLVMALEALEVLLEPGALGKQPGGRGIGDEAREREVQAEAGLVDEIIHIGFVPAVIIAAEEAA